MRLKHIKGTEKLINDSIFVIKNPEQYRGKWKKVFRNNNKIFLEIGMGKGSFLIEQAKRNPNINFIGIEKYSSVLYNAVEYIGVHNITNIRIICMDAYNVDKVFRREISKLYLNFSDPWPKKRHEKRRLTNSIFLDKYKHIFKYFKVIEQKTDNDDFFKYSLQSYKKNHYRILELSNNYLDEVKTEYETKYILRGKNINYVKVFKL